MRLNNTVYLFVSRCVTESRHRRW